MSKYDIIIIGSGLGGLECGAILSKEGYHVCVLEKNELFGGCFQTYQRGGISVSMMPFRTLNGCALAMILQLP
jgi:phytoene dehydrogenase-like protein